MRLSDVDQMAYYYYYQQHHTPPESLSPGTMASELNPSLPPLLLLPPQQLQQQLTLPLVTPVLPSVTTTLPLTTSTATNEYNQQQQSLTPKLSPFLRHCEESGLFQDLRNIGAISSLTGPLGDTITTSVPDTTTATIVTTTSTEPTSNSNLFSLSSSAILTPVMENPFDETFKQAFLLQQKRDSNLAENIFCNNNNSDGDLNTPFISTTSMNPSNNHNNSSLTKAALPMDMLTTAVVATPITVESTATNTSNVLQPQQQNVFMTSGTESTTGSLLVMMMEQQQNNSIVSIQTQHQLHLADEQHQFIVPTSMAIPGENTKTITFHDQDFNDTIGDRDKNDRAIHAENETIAIKRTLKQNLLVKRQMQEQQKCPLKRLNPRKSEPHNLEIAFATSDVEIQNKGNSGDYGQEEKNNQKQQLQQKLKKELLERNRTAAKRCRLKRKQRWELLSEENRKLKMENSRLRDVLAKIINREHEGQQQTIGIKIQKQQHQAENQNTCITEKNV